MDDHGAVVEPPVAPHRRADQQHGPQLPARRHQIADRRLDRVEQGVLQQQVVDSVGGQAQLGKHDQVAGLCVAVARQGDRLGDIEGRLTGPDSGRGGGDPHETLAVVREERVGSGGHGASGG